MKKIKYVLLFFIFFLVLGCNKTTNIQNINYSEYTKLIDNKETFILEVMRDGCSHCTSLKPKLQKIADEYNLKIQVINLAKLSETEFNEFTDIIGTSATPTIIFYKNGEEKSVATRILGNVSEEKIINKLKDNGFIK